MAWLPRAVQSAAAAGVAESGSEHHAPGAACTHWQSANFCGMMVMTSSKNSRAGRGLLLL
ncbi:MAG: hypothetical protein RBR41_08500 [Desulfovibrio sp.]|uniref:hypothetical protein n=1 Tax=Desulfovibrio sp. TaxID=885 RepID=UPI002A368924|nr:hypothetical protein [Desulfovibrio sp.]MDY0259692.1 hypothetical protein [Desulfovibrio sp.]